MNMFRKVVLSIILAVLLVPAVARAQSVEVVGGSPATPGAWPFMAAILSSNNPTSLFCGGSLIAPTWVVSAAHCFYENGGSVPTSGVKVGLGLHQLSAGGGQIYSVKRIIIHPQYNPNTNDYDMALVELNGSSSKTPVSVNTSSTDITGATATAIGWGLTDPNDDNSISDVLRQVNVPIVSNTACNSSYGGITARMVCAGYAQGGKDTCSGDSGGPLVAMVSGQLKLVGVTSFGDGCAEPLYYGVYARVAQFSSFISQYVTTSQPTPTPTPSATPTPLPPTQTNGKYGLWNGYLGMTNIAELTNSSSQSVTAQVNMFSMNGTLISSSFFVIGGSSQQDVILNTLPGFAVDSYGLVQISSNVDGRIFFYRARDNTFTNFEYALGIPFQSGKTGTLDVGFNTFQPSFNIADQQNIVANWLTVVNLSTSAQSYTIKKYSSVGELLSQQSVSIAAKSRADFEAGHVNPGPSNVGLIEVVPTNSSALYIAELMRYGYGTAGSFDFAFPLLADGGTSSTITVPIGSKFTEQNWLEVINAGSATNSVVVNIYSSAGALLSTQNLNLGAKAQQHINMNGFLGDRKIGYARIASQNSQPVVAESMFYFRNASSGSITGMYGSQAKIALMGSKQGSFNLFLGMENYLKLSNPSDQSMSVNVTVSSSFSSGSSRTVTLPANSSSELNLHDTSTYGTIANSYGVVTVAPTDPSRQVVREILRIKKETSGDIQFSAPTDFN